jgi:hypothetical protein
LRDPTPTTRVDEWAETIREGLTIDPDFDGAEAQHAGIYALDVLAAHAKQLERRVARALSALHAAEHAVAGGCAGCFRVECHAPDCSIAEAQAALREAEGRTE